jgi:hypothetical protein
MRIEVNMRHGHPPGWAPQEIGLFIDSHCRDGRPLPIAGDPVISANEVRMTYSSAVPLKAAALHYTTDIGLRSGRTWHTVTAAIHNDLVIAPKPPADASTWFIAITDDRGAMVTSCVKLRSESAATTR